LTPVLTYLVVKIITNKELFFSLRRNLTTSLSYTMKKELKNEEMNGYSLGKNKSYHKLKLYDRDMNENENLWFLIWRSAY
jgi:hypothetical protein